MESKQRFYKNILVPYIDIISVLSIIIGVIIALILIGEYHDEHMIFYKYCIDFLPDKSDIFVSLLIRNILIGGFVMLLEIVYMFGFILHISLMNRFVDSQDNLFMIIISYTTTYTIMKYIMMIYNMNVYSLTLIIMNYIQTPVILIGLIQMVNRLIIYFNKKDIEKKV